MNSPTEADYELYYEFCSKRAESEVKVLLDKVTFDKAIKERIIMENHKIHIQIINDARKKFDAEMSVVPDKQFLESDLIEAEKHYMNL